MAVKNQTTVSLKDFEKGIKELEKKFSGPALVEDLDYIAEQLLNLAIKSPIPRDKGDLARSATTVVDRSKNVVTFGFNKIYAAFQDSKGRTRSRIIRPKRKRWLFIPLTQRARRHRYGANPENEGFVFGGFVLRVGGGRRSSVSVGADYVLAKESIIPVRPYGSTKGPNKYFSETITKNKDRALQILAGRIKSRLTKGKGAKP